MYTDFTAIIITVYCLCCIKNNKDCLFLSIIDNVYGYGILNTSI